MRRAWNTLWGGLILLAAGAAAAQSAAQLDMLQSLPEEQKRALLRQYAPELNQQPQRLEAGAPIVRDLSPEEEQAITQPETKTAGAELKPFGYDLFRSQPTTLAPVSDVPVPAEYVLGPGDQLQVQLTGKESDSYTLVIDRSGKIFLPEIGAVTVAGLSFQQARERVSSRVAEAKLGVQAAVDMGELRTMRIFVAGDVRNPGSYTVSALSTITQALYVSGGVQEIGSLRRVQLKRDGRVVATLDLYDLLLSGDRSDDDRLLAGDVVFVPPVGPTVGVGGAVRRPAIYEMRGPATVTDAVAMAGGMLPGAAQTRVSVERVRNGYRSLLPASLDAAPAMRVEAGDTVRVTAAQDVAYAGVTLLGPAVWPGVYPVSEQTRLSDILRSSADLEPETDLDFALVLRRTDGGAGLRAIYANPRAAWLGEEGANIAMLPGDEVHVFRRQLPDQDQEQQTPLLSADDDEEAALLADTGVRASSLEAAEDLSVESTQDGESSSAREPNNPPQDHSANGLQARVTAHREDDRITRMQKLAARVESLSSLQRPPEVVAVVGAVRFPSKLPLDMTRHSITDVLRAAGGLLHTAEQGFVEVTHAPQRNNAQSLAETSIVRLDSAKLSRFMLRPGDTLAVRTVPGMRDTRTVTILGEVFYPGTYTVGRNTTLKQLVERAGGLSPDAYTAGAVFTREDLQRKERTQVQRLKQRLRSDLTTAALTQGQQGGVSLEGMQAVQGLLDELAAYPALGRLVIDLDAQLVAQASAITVEDGDTLIIPPTPEEVTITGEVQFPTSHRWQPGMSAKDYLRLSGGPTRMADAKRGFIVRADGSVQSLRTGWFRRSPRMQPGDVIVMPVDATPIQPITLFSTVTQVVYQLALSLAAFNAVGAF